MRIAHSGYHEIDNRGDEKTGDDKKDFDTHKPARKASNIIMEKR